MPDANSFITDYSKRKSKCQKCKEELEVGSLRIGKLVANFMSDGDLMKQYFHVKCLFESFKRARQSTKVIESVDEIDNFVNLKENDKKTILEHVKELEKHREGKGTSNKKTSSNKKSETNSNAKESISNQDSTEEEDSVDEEDDNDDNVKELKEETEDDTFEVFERVCDLIKNDSSHLKKTAIIEEFLDRGSSFLDPKESKRKYKGDMYLFIKLLLPSTSTRVYNVNSKQLVKHFSKIFHADQEEMLDHLNKGDVADTVKHYFKKSTKHVKPLTKSVLTLKEVDKYLDKLTKVTKDQEQIDLLKEIAKKCTPNDLAMLIRLIKKDLRLDAGERIVLDAVNKTAYQAFQSSRNLKEIIEKAKKIRSGGKAMLNKNISTHVDLMTPIKPMLAEACKSVEKAFEKCKNGIFAEIKYDGERLQLHKNGNKFDYFSRNLKKMQPHKVEHLKEYIPKAFPKAQQLILDGEILLYDTKTKKPLPFGTLGVHKKSKFQDATVCLFVFDCVFLNGKDLMKEPIDSRRKILEENMTEIPGRIMFSEKQLMKNPAELRKLVMKVIHEGLEGLVLKDSKSIYEPGKRKWLKIKKDYLDAGKMADTADLVVLGANYGTGRMGGLKSVFLMGCINKKTGKWYTVTKVGNGLNDDQIDKLQKDIKMIPIKKNYDLKPDWLEIDKSQIPDFIVKDPKNSPVWEITGAEFSESDTHTADGISIRFPRVTRIRDDKSWKEATDLERLKELFRISKEKSDIISEDDDEKPKSKVLKSAKKRSKSDSDDESGSDDEKPSPKKKLASSKITSYNKKTSAKKMQEDDESDDSTGLPSVFEGKKFFLANGISKTDELKRYLFAYGGEILDENSLEEATDIVTSSTDSMDEKIEKKLPTKAIKISEKKIWQIIKSQSNQGK